MAYERKDNSGMLFINERKQKDTHADYRGKAKIDGCEYYVDMWFSQTRSGVECLNLRFKPIDEAQASPERPRTTSVPKGFAERMAKQQTPVAQSPEPAAQREPEPGTQRDIIDDDIPF